MVDQPLVDNDDLGDLPGAPFPATVLTAAAAAIRTDAGWHIAPVVAHTVEIETRCASVVLLPSLRVVEVSEVRDGDTGAVLTGWRVNKRTGVLRRRGGVWPEWIEVDLEHGYDACPPELHPLIAERAQRIASGI